MAEKKTAIAIVCANFNMEITEPMLQEAVAFAKKQGAEVKAVVEVPGAYEIPFACKKLLARKDINAIAAVGAVIKGETKHDEVITQAIAIGLLSISCEFEKPIGLGISGPGQTWEQAKARAKDYAHRAVHAALTMAKKKY